MAPTARPTKIETLNRKRLAVDASIWIYQFLKAVRDKEGNALRNSHVVGFFRRICKLLYFGIKPVFVFDGGAPILKRETIRQRARRREGRRDDAARTAGKLLAVQVARAAEEEAQRQKDEVNHADEEVIPTDQELVYVDEIGMDQQQRQAGRSFRKQDQYHLPELNLSLAEMGAPNDPRVMSQAELEQYAQQFHTGEDINLYDFSKIDFDSPFFQSLPAGDKYNILNAARLRSRLRMGYSKEQLDDMFPDRMAFSRFQIERVKERNELTQRLMHVSGMNEEEWDMGARIAGERGKEYVLVPHDGVEGGWALGVVSNKKGSKKDSAIDLEAEEDGDDEMPEDEDEFEDVPIEGVNRIPKTWKRKRHQTREVDYDVSYEEAAERIAKKRKAVYEARKKAAGRSHTTENVQIDKVEAPPSMNNEPSTGDGGLFVEQDGSDNDDDDIFEDVTMSVPVEDEDDDLQRAIAMSLEKEAEDQGAGINSNDPHQIQADDKEGGFDFGSALAASRAHQFKAEKGVINKVPSKPAKAISSGPLPFESLNLGQSLLGKKKAEKTEEQLSGGFNRDLGDEAFEKRRKPAPVPDWFDNSAEARPQWQQNMDNKFEPDNLEPPKPDTQESRSVLSRTPSKEVIDLEDDEANGAVGKELEGLLEPTGEQWDNAYDEEELKRQEDADRRALEAEEVAEARRQALREEREKRYDVARQIAAENNGIDISKPSKPVKANIVTVLDQSADTTTHQDSTKTTLEPAEDQTKLDTVEEEVEWSESNREASSPALGSRHPSSDDSPKRKTSKKEAIVMDEDDDDEFEDVVQPAIPEAFAQKVQPQLPRNPSKIDESMLVDDPIPADDDTSGIPNDTNEDFLADDSDEELMRQLANETEEHLRFANELNNTRAKSPSQAIRDYENEVKQLRNQQKKDRRDADEVTQTMILECQALLRLFGLPYITAPMEAEAQCAELVQLGLVDGIVTDDSDIFLFGGTRIYKNMFNAQKFVECYIAKDLDKEYALDRRKLIRFAHLLGSDYTEGIPGIGPVTALEIISDFGDLVEFKDWTLKVQLGVQTPSVLEDLLNTAFRRKFKRTVQKKLFLPTNFPDLRVDSAYLEPEVDSNPEEFQWGVPDLDKLRSFLMATIGWSRDRTDEVLVPVIRDINRRDLEGVQSNITRFFAGGVGAGAGSVPPRGINGYNGPGEERVEGTAPRNRTGKESGRMKNAYTRLRGEAGKKKARANAREDLEVGDSAQESDQSDQVNETKTSEAANNSAPKKSKRRRGLST